MTRKPKVRITWSVKYPLEMGSFAMGTVSAMTDNEHVPNPDVSLSMMEEAGKNISLTYSNRKNGNVGKDDFNTSLKILDDLLHKQAEYVSKLADGNTTIIHSTGFISTADKRGAGVLPGSVKSPTITNLSGGAIKVQVPKVANAINYCFILVLEGPFNVKLDGDRLLIFDSANTFIINSTKRTAIFNNLPPLKEIRVAVMVNNAKGCSSLSDIIHTSTIL